MLPSEPIRRERIYLALLLLLTGGPAHSAPLPPESPHASPAIASSLWRIQVTRGQTSAVQSNSANVSLEILPDSETFAGEATIDIDLAKATSFVWLHGFELRRVLLWIAGPFLIADVISLINPEEFYDKLLKPSLGALFVSQLIVFLVFPLFRRGIRWLPLVAVASALAVWGFYTLVSGSAST